MKIKAKISAKAGTSTSGKGTPKGLTKGASQKFVNTYSGRSGSSAALVSPLAKRKVTGKGGVEFNTDRQISAAGKAYGTTGSELGTEYTTVRTGKAAKKTYAKAGKFSQIAKPITPNKKGK